MTTEKMPRKIARSFALLTFLFVAIAACSKNNDGVSLAELEATCSLNSDCVSPLVCAFKTCHVECTPSDGGGSRDCPNGEQCLASDRPFYVCQNPNETSCTYNSDCPSPLVCGRDLTCRDECQMASDCQSGQLCVTGTCANVSQLVDGGLVPPAGADAAVQVTPSCTFNSDCTAPDICRPNGFCGLECKTDRDCAVGLVCTDNRCAAPVASVVDAGDATVASPVDANMSPVDANDLVDASDATILSAVDANEASSVLNTIPDGAPDGYASSCQFDSDCPVGLVCNRAYQCTYECIAQTDCDVEHGFCCSQYHTCLTGSVCTSIANDGGAADAGVDASHVDGAAPCVNDTTCQDGIFCNGFERCVAGTCTAAATTACDDADPCTSDTCTEATQSCSHVATGPIDQDHDGHYAASCGPGGDDCDDTNPNVYPGHAEVCDFVDNNCNGQIDENAWVEGAVTTFGGGANNSTGVWPPVVIPRGDGTFVVARNQGYPGGVEMFTLSASLVASNGVLVGPPGNTSSGEQYNNYFALASGNSLLGLGETFNGTALATFITPDLTTQTSSVTLASGNANAGGTALLWVPSQQKWAALWGDTHETGTPTVYTTWIAPAPSGADAGTSATITGTTRAIIGTGTSGQMSGSPYYHVWPLAGPSSVFVAFRSGAGPVSWVILDPTMTSVLAGPFSAAADSLNDNQLVSQAYIDTNGTSAVLVTSDTGENNAYIRIIDLLSGAVTAQTTVSNAGYGQAEFQMASFHSGYLFTRARYTTIEYGWTPSLATPFSYTQIGSFGVGDTPGGPAITPIDDQHALIVWQDQSTNTMEATIMSCTATN